MTTDDLPGQPAGAPPAAVSCGEDRRVEVLASYGYGALEEDEELAAIAGFAARLCSASIAFVSVVESESQLFIARSGSDLRGTPRSQSFCAHAMLESGVMEVHDAAADARFHENPLVTGAAHVRFYAGAPLKSEEGVPLGALCVIDTAERPGGLDDLQREGLVVLAQSVMRRLDGRRRGREASLRQSESARAMREIADLLPAIVWSADGDAKFDYYNARWAEITDAPPPQVLDDWLTVVHEEDGDRAGDAWLESFHKGEPFEAEFRLRQADGTWRWMMSRALPFRDSDGVIRRWYGTLTDIDSSRRLSESRDILARELSHRIKNIFAVVAGLVSIRARKHEPAKAFAEELNGAIRALGRAHDFVGPMGGVRSDSLRGLLAELMAPYADDDGRVVITGEDCEIGARGATPLALIFHELATNSAKYGALSVPGGSIVIDIDCPEADGISRIHWRERGGPEPVETVTEGFGTRLVKLSIEGQLGGKMERRFAPGGLEVDLEIPLPAMRG